jgi:hypothetical protein
VEHFRCHSAKVAGSIGCSTAQVAGSADPRTLDGKSHGEGICARPRMPRVMI